ncbi:hypothetical protein KUC_3048 [Vreelandella boliviensis LC1]|uniref:Uncharacterized protein n=1 Tax=Vreelandella boliviensis LC1 TaxID=1072583 RepID=A0A7U9GEV0_9GAMM|nr:hypothetical protein KUC_3048 [Halomonas boliviensis LC1]
MPSWIMIACLQPTITIGASVGERDERHACEAPYTLLHVS